MAVMVTGAPGVVVEEEEEEEEAGTLLASRVLLHKLLENALTFNQQFQASLRDPPRNTYQKFTDRAEVRGSKAGAGR